MLLADLSEARDYTHIFIAPHLDDVVLSCGGIVARQVASRQAILVVTICAGSPDPAEPLHPFAAYLHEAWQLGPDPVALRRTEDERALARLAVDGLHLNELDAIYRTPPYATREAVFGLMHPHDPLIGATGRVLQTLRDQNPAATLYLPLGVGNHVDHQAVYAARVAVRGTPIAFYEDFPYAAVPEAVNRRLAVLGNRFLPSVVALGNFLPRKTSAIAEYRSQLAELFPYEPMDDVVSAYAMQVGSGRQPSERLWLGQM